MKLSSLLNDLNNEQQQSPQKQTNRIWSDVTFNMVTKTYSSSPNELPERIFIKRNSLLTQMFKVIVFALKLNKYLQ